LGAYSCEVGRENRKRGELGERDMESEMTADSSPSIAQRFEKRGRQKRFVLSPASFTAPTTLDFAPCA
jgi:hypothetical protein